MAQKGINKCILIGNLGKDPEVRQMSNGNSVASVSLATSEEWIDKSTNQKKSKVEWHKVIFFGKLAEIVGQYLKKGSKVYVEGKLSTKKWTGQDGQDRYTTEVVVDGFQGQMQMLDSKPSGGAGSANQGHGQSRPAAAPAASAPGQGGGQDFNDSIPF